jgi:hypothetical protein
MTIRSLAHGLGVSTSTAHKFSKLGCPLDDLEAAKGWVRDRAQSAPTPSPSATATLTEQRRQKLILECQLLAIKIEREAANTEFLPVSEVLQAVRVFMRFAHLALRMRCDTFAERIAAESSPVGVIKLLRTLADEGWATGAAAMAAQAQSSRMAAAISQTIQTEFVGVDDGQVEKWKAELSLS